MNIEQALAQAKLHIHLSQKEEARGILVSILRIHPNNAEAWLLSAQVSDEMRQVLYCLQQARKIDPTILDTHPNMPKIRILMNKLLYPASTMQSTQSDKEPEYVVEPVKINEPASSRLFSRTIKYLLGRVLTISITLFVGVFITVVIANRGGQIDSIVMGEVDEQYRLCIPSHIVIGSRRPPKNRLSLISCNSFMQNKLACILPSFLAICSGRTGL